MPRLNYLARFALLVVSVFFLLLALWAGLSRLGWTSAWLQSRFVPDHGAFMVCGFLGTLISLERSVALGRWWGYIPPFVTALGSLDLAAGLPPAAGEFLIALGSLGLVRIFISIGKKQPALFTVTMGLGAAAWLVGNILWLDGVAIPEMVHWWIGFLVLTIVGERLELNRFLSPAWHTKATFLIGLGTFSVGLVLASLIQVQGNRITGIGMVVFALWLVRYDVARFTIRQSGLPRFIALCLFGGYAWLGIGGLVSLFAVLLAKMGSSPYLIYDAMLHTIFLGFVFSMIFAHAPIVFPAVTGQRLAFRRVFYAPVLLLHLSLAWRVAGDLAGSLWAHRWGGLVNVLALLIFLASNAYGMAVARRDSQRSPGTRGQEA